MTKERKKERKKTKYLLTDPTGKVCQPVKHNVVKVSDWD